MLKKAFDTIEGYLITEFGAASVALGNIATDTTSARVLITLINLKEEKALKNTAYSRVNQQLMKTEYFNPYIYLNAYILFCSKSPDYKTAIEDVARIVKSFHKQNIFEFPEGGEQFKIVLELFSPNFEEVNHIWGTLGGKMYPNIIYIMRVTEVKQTDVVEGDGVITQIEQKFSVIESK